MDVMEIEKNKIEECKKLFVTVKELSQVFSIAEDTLYGWAERGLIPSYKIGRLRRFKLDEVKIYFEKFKQNANEKNVERNFG